MTTISNLSSTTNVQAVSHHGHHRGGGGPLEAAATTLGMSRDDLMNELGSGKSLADIATDKGVSTDDLAAAIKAALPKQVQSSDDVDSVVSTIMTRQGPPPPPPGGPRGFGQPDTSVSGVLGDSLTSSQKTMLDGLSNLVGTDSDSLLDQLRSGTSLTDVLSNAGVSTDKLASILQDGLLVDTQA